MAAPIIQAEYDVLEEMAQRFTQQAERTLQMTQTIQRNAEQLVNGSWQGRGIAAFDAEMTNLLFPALERLTGALEQGGSTTLEIVETIRTAEEDAASPFLGDGAAVAPVDSGGEAGRVDAPVSGGNDSGNGNPSFLDRVLGIATDIVGFADTLDDILPIPAAILLASALRNGSTYGGQVLVRAPQWFSRLGISGRRLRDLAGVAENLSHIKGANMARHIARGARKIPILGWAIAAGQGITSVANVWNDNWGEYGQLDGPERTAAMGVDAGIALLPVATEVAGGVAGVAIGSYGGAALGGLIGGLGGPFAVVTVPAGAAAGAFIGGAVGGFVGDWLGGKAGDWLVGRIDAGDRAAAIDFVTDNVTRPIADGVSSVANGISSAVDEVGSWVPDIGIPSFGFSW